MTTFAIVFAILICAGVLFGIRSMKKDVDLDILLARAPRPGCAMEIERILAEVGHISQRNIGGLATWEQIGEVLESSRWWLKTSHALLREPHEEWDSGDLLITQEKIKREYNAVLTLHWKARIEVAVGKLIPVQYVYFTSVLRHYTELTNLVHYACAVVRSDLQDSLEAIT